MTELLIRHFAVLALAAVLSIALRRQSAAQRHALWVIALAVCIFLPILQRMPIPLPVEVAKSLDLERVSTLPVVDSVAREPRTLATTQPSTPDGRTPWLPFVWSVYSAVAAALVLRWGFGWLLVVRLARTGKARGKVQGIPIVVVDRVGPLTFGWPGAVILVPHMNFNLDSPVIRHELAHIRRADFVWQGVGAIACALWWFSPAVWFAARMMRREAEYACDDIVLNLGVPGPDYAECLLEIAAMKSRSLPIADSLVHAIPKAQRSDLANRITGVLTNRPDRVTAKPLVVLGLVAILLPFGLYISRPVLAADTGALRGKMIVLDPGHGGRDYGVRSGGLRDGAQKESDINLAIALRAAELLRKEGAIVTLTRDDDTYVDLRRRAEYSAGQDLYLSIHVGADRAPPNESRPFPLPVYFHGTPDSPQYPGAMRLAKALVSAASASSVGVAFQGQVSAAPFRVLQNAECPAYLVDFGSMTNYDDLAKLRDPAFLDRMSSSLVDGARVILK